MPISVFLSLASYSFVTSITPGPNNILVLNSALNYGLRKTVKLLIGIFIGILATMFVCSIMSLGLSNVSNSYMVIAKYVGTAYILWLAYRVAFSKPEEKNDNRSYPSFLMGMALQIVNIKLILFGILAYSNFILPYHTDLPILFLFAVLLAIMGGLGTFAWGIAGDIFQKLLFKYYRFINVILALMLVQSAVSILLIKQ